MKNRDEYQYASNWYALFAAIVTGERVEDILKTVLGTDYAHKPELLTDEELEMRELVNCGMTYKEVAELFGVNTNTLVGRIGIKH
jgi:DNA-binding NarL/FixJ family response regulator